VPLHSGNLERLTVSAESPVVVTDATGRVRRLGAACPAMPGFNWHTVSGYGVLLVVGLAREVGSDFGPPHLRHLNF
jgi:hypothetical protein